MPISLLLFWGSLLLAAAGAGFIVYGWIGRRVGDDVFCARCGYNLRGRDLRKLDEQCTECGAKIDRRGATHVGIRHRRPVAITLGMLLLLLGMPLLLAAALAGARGVSLAEYKPLWLLRLDAECGDIDTELTALAEIDRRVTGGQVPPEELRRLAVLGLRLGTERSASVGQAWARIVHAAWSAGLVPREAIDTLLRDELRVELFFPGAAEVETLVPFGFRYEAKYNPAAIAIDLVEVEAELSFADRKLRMPLTTNMRGRPARAVHSVANLSEVRRRFMRSDDLYAFDPSVDLGVNAPGDYPIEAVLTVEVRQPGQAPIRYLLNASTKLMLVRFDTRPAAAGESTRQTNLPAVAGARGTSARNLPRLDPWNAPSLSLPPAPPPPAATQSVALAVPPSPLDLPLPPPPSTQPAGLALAPPALILPVPQQPSTRPAPPLPDVKLRPVLPEWRPKFGAAARGDKDLSRIERSLRRQSALERGALEEYEFHPDDFSAASEPPTSRRRGIGAEPPTSRPAGDK